MANTFAQELHAERNRLVGQAREIMERKDEAGLLSAEDQSQFDAVTERAADLNDKLEVYKQFEEDAVRGDRSAELTSELIGRADAGEVEVNRSESEEVQHRGAIRRMADNVTRGFPSGSIELRPHVYRDWRELTASGSGTEIARAYAIGDLTNLAANESGGVTVPTMVEQRFFEVLVNIDGVRKAGAQVWNTASGEPTRFPKAADIGTAPPTQAEITGEAALIAEDSADITSVNSTPVKVTGLSYISRELLTDSYTNIENKIAEMLARQIAWKSEYLYNNGTGSSQPKGVLHTPPAGQTVTQAARNTLAYTEIVNTKYQVANYPMGGGKGPCWSMRKSTFGRVVGLTATDGHPIFQLSVAMGMPDRLIGDPVVYNEFAGTLNNVNEYLMVYGDFYNGYVIRDVGNVELFVDTSIQFLNDRYAYKATLRTDGRILNSQLFGYLREKSS